MAMEALHDILCGVLEAPFLDGGSHCYFEPPANIKMLYPCIVYHRTNFNADYADNMPYKISKRYTVTIIDEDPDSKIPSRLMNTLPYCSSDRIFATEGLSHFVYTLSYNGPRIKEENEDE